jgi:nucleoside-diphosphate-sugar epimerase
MLLSHIIRLGGSPLLPAPSNGENNVRIFITGASGWIGSALTAELIAAGHHVTGLARSDASAEKITSAGGTAVRGDMRDHDLIVSEARRADAVAHLAFTLDFAEFDETVDNEVELISKIGIALEGTGKALIAASGTPILFGQVATEEDVLDPAGPAGSRARTASAVLALSDMGIRSALVRMPRSVHGKGDNNGLIAALVGLDRQLGTAAYVGDGQNRWPAVHISDAARLFFLALEKAPSGSVLHAVGEEGVPMRRVAEVIAAKTGLPAAAVDPEQLGVFGALLGGDQPSSATATRRLLGWEPSGPTLLDDLEAGYYTD